MESHGLVTSPLESVPSVQLTTVQLDVLSIRGGQLGSPCRNNISIAPHLLPRLRDLFYSGHGSFIPLGEGVTSPCRDVTVRLTRLTVPVASAKFVHGIGFLTEAICTQAR